MGKEIVKSKSSGIKKGRKVAYNPSRFNEDQQHLHKKVKSSNQVTEKLLPESAGFKDAIVEKLLKTVVEQPQLFLPVQTGSNRKNDNLSTIKDALKMFHESVTAGAQSLPKRHSFLPSIPVSQVPATLFVDDAFDNEQIWQQLQLWHPVVINYTKKLLDNNEVFIDEDAEKSEKKKKKKKKSKKTKKNKELQIEKAEESNEDNEEDEILNGNEDGIEENFEDEEESVDPRKSKGRGKGKGKADDSTTKKGQKHPADDRFFSMDDMEAFVRDAERRAGEDEDDEIDYFQDVGSDDENDLESDEEIDQKKKGKKAKKPSEMKYSDFFDPEEKDDAEDELWGGENFDEAEGTQNEEGFGEDDLEEDGFEGDAFEDNDEEMEEDNFEEDDEQFSYLNEGENAQQKKMKYANKELFDDDEEAEDGLSKFEKRQQKIAEMVQELEEDSLGEKHWSLKGEASSKARPVNSLLEEDLEFEHASKTVPIITEEVTLSLEEKIKKRILDGLFDDVERKYEEDFTPFDKKKSREQQMILDGEKSKKSLSEIYEDQFMNNVNKSTNGEGTGDLKDEKTQLAHKKLTALYNSLCSKLDALSNFHFTPKPVREEIEIITNTPAISMEEVTPVNVSDASRLAPEEIYNKKDGKLVVGSSEITSEEKQRARADKKRIKRKQKRQQQQEKKIVEKMNPGLGNKYSKEKALQSLQGSKNVIVAKENDSGTKYSSSSSVFSKLQDEVTGQAPLKRASKNALLLNKNTSNEKQVAVSNLRL